MKGSLFGRTKYRVMLKGHNLRRREEESGQETVFGFFTTRCVRAHDEREAELLAVAAVRSELEAIGTLALQGQQPSISVEEVEKVSTFRGIPNSGFTLFPEKDAKFD